MYGNKKPKQRRKDGQVYDLAALIVEEVSSVDEPAIDEPFYFTKAQPKGSQKGAFTMKKFTLTRTRKADPPPAPAGAPTEAGGAATGMPTNGDVYEALTAYMEALVAVANEIEGAGDMEAPIVPEAAKAIEAAMSAFNDAIGLSVEEPVAQNADGQVAQPATPQPVTQSKAKGGSIKLTGDKATRFNVAMEILGSLFASMRGAAAAVSEEVGDEAAAPVEETKASAQLATQIKQMAGALSIVAKEVQRQGSLLSKQGQVIAKSTTAEASSLPIDGPERDAGSQGGNRSFKWSSDLNRDRRAKRA